MSARSSVDSLERIIVAGVALTTAALSHAHPGLELTLAQWRVVLILGSRTDAMSVSAVAAAIGVTLPATSRQLRRLEGRGLILIEPDVRDRRSVRVSLTATGRDLRAAVIAFRRDAIAGMVVDVEDMPGLDQALASIADAMERIEHR